MKPLLHISRDLIELYRIICVVLGYFSQILVVTDGRGGQNLW